MQKMAGDLASGQGRTTASVVGTGWAWGLDLDMDGE